MGRILPIELKEFTATAVTGSYQAFGTVLSNPALKMSFFNTSNADVYISKDGVTNMCRIPANGTLTLDESTLYFRGVDQEYYVPKGSQLYVKQVVAPGASGSIIAHIVTRVQA